MNKEEILDKVRTVLKFCQDWFVNNGGFRSPKVVFMLSLFLYCFYVFIKQRGWLPKKSIRGEHIFLTGAGSGIGRLMAIQFAKMGCQLSLSDVNMEGLEETKKIVSSKVGSAVADQNVIIFKCDVSSPESVKAGAKLAQPVGLGAGA